MRVEGRGEGEGGTGGGERKRGRRTRRGGVDLPVHSAPLQMIVTETAPVLVKQLVAHAGRHLSLKQAATGGLIVGGGWTAAYDDKRRFNTPCGKASKATCGSRNTCCRK